MIEIDIDGKILLIDSEDHYRYNVIYDETREITILLRDDGHRIHSIYISKNPINPPRGQRDWELLWEYKHVEAPGVREVVDKIMQGT